MIEDLIANCEDEGFDDVITYALMNEYNEETLIELLNAGHIPDPEDTFVVAIEDREDTITIFKLFMERGFLPDGSVYANAVDINNIEIIQLMKQYNVPWSDQIFELILERECHLETIQCLEKLGYFQWDHVRNVESMNSSYVKVSETMRYLHDHDFPSKWTCDKYCPFC